MTLVPEWPERRGREKEEKFVEREINCNLNTHCKFSQSTCDLKFKQWMTLNTSSLLKEESFLGEK